MSRYKGTRIQKRKGSRNYSTTIYNKVPVLDTDLYFITQEGDRLDNLAYFFYGDSSLWWVIANANNLTTLNVKPGMKMLIPK